jgi:hypothetical protein
MRNPYKTIGDIRKSLNHIGRHPSWIHAQVRSHNRWYNSALEKRCQACGYDKHVEHAHIKPISSFDEDTLLIVVNAPENNLVLCRNCHWEYDNGLLRAADIPPRRSTAL